MSISNSLAPHLPFLRRFARAMTGSQSVGDALVVKTLQRLRGSRDHARIGEHPRVELYKAFLDVWRASPASIASEDNNGTPAEHNLRALSPKARQAFLLLSVEGFSPKDAAEILHTTEEGIARLVDLVGHEIADQVATDVLIIEDEPLIAMDLREILAALGHTVVGTARTHREAVALFSRFHPGLLLADVQLADGSSGLNAVNEILATFDVPVIFITAYPERLLTGERPEPTFLIAKPFEPSVVRSLVSQALFFGTKARLAHRASSPT